MNARESFVTLPFTFNSDLLNLFEEIAVFELEAFSVRRVDVRVIVNVNALDEKITF